MCIFIYMIVCLGVGSWIGRVRFVIFGSVLSYLLCILLFDFY